MQELKFKYLECNARHFVVYDTEEVLSRSQWSRGLRRGSVADRLLGLWFLSICYDCCVLSGRGLCIGVITRSEESYRLCCVWVWSWILDNEEALAHCGLLRHGKNKRTTYFFRRLSFRTYLYLVFVCCITLFTVIHLSCWYSTTIHLERKVTILIGKILTVHNFHFLNTDCLKFETIICWWMYYCDLNPAAQF